MATTVSFADSNLRAKTRPEPDTTFSNPTRPLTIFNLSFNQTRNCFAVGTDSGFLVYSCDPFRLSFRREFDTGGGFGLIRMLNDSQIFAVVGGGPDPILPANKVMIWDDRQARGLYDMSLRSDVRGVRLRPDRIVVVLKQKIAVYGFGKENMDEILTTVNPNGLCEVSQCPGPMVLTCPGLHKGEIRVRNFGNNRSTFIKAHKSSLACLGLTQDGRYLATASTKGTLIRIYDTSDGTLLQEVRRGSEKAEIYSLGFSCTGQWLAVSSDKGTVHVFRVKLDLGSAESGKLSSSTTGGGVPSPSRISSLVKGVLPKYFSSEWSVAKFPVPVGLQHIVAFGKQKNTIMIIGMDGSFYRCGFDPVKGGEMAQLEHHNFFKPKDFYSLYKLQPIPN